MEGDELIQTKIQAMRAAIKKQPIIPVKTRLCLLKQLSCCLRDLQDVITAALAADLGKSADESYLTEIGLVRTEITYMLRHLRRFVKPKRVYTPVYMLGSTSYRISSPYGLVAIISPWNYPLMLTLLPLVDALAAGNRVIIKPSNAAPQTAHVIKQIIHHVFRPEMVNVVLGNEATAKALVDSDLDYIFFTGSNQVGKVIAQKAAQRLIPYTLELGGKNPCIVDQFANLAIAARRIVFGKWLNAGQTCVAPDYVYCHAAIKDQLVHHLVYEIKKQYGTDSINNPHYPRIVNAQRFNVLTSFLDAKSILYGGQFNAQTSKIAPTLLDADFTSPIMQEEIFGPLLPIVTFNDWNEVANNLSQLPTPLAFYVFSNNKQKCKALLTQCRFGDACINDVIMQIANPHLGFGGVFHSGFGKYHGQAGFNVFSYNKSVVKTATTIDLPLRYQPVNKIKRALIKFFLR